MVRVKRELLQLKERKKVLNEKIKQYEKAELNFNDELEESIKINYAILAIQDLELLFNKNKDLFKSIELLKKQYLIEIEMNENDKRKNETKINFLDELLIKLAVN